MVNSQSLHQGLSRKVWSMEALFVGGGVQANHTVCRLRSQEKVLGKYHAIRLLRVLSDSQGSQTIPNLLDI